MATSVQHNSYNKQAIANMDSCYIFHMAVWSSKPHQIAIKCYLVMGGCGEGWLAGHETGPSEAEKLNKQSAMYTLCNDTDDATKQHYWWCNKHWQKYIWTFSQKNELCGDTINNIQQSWGYSQHPTSYIKQESASKNQRMHRLPAKSGVPGPLMSGKGFQ